MGTTGPTSAPADEGEEAQLLAGLRAGREEAFEQMVRRYGPRMLAVAQRLLGSESETRDALQDAFVSAFQGLSRFEGGSQLGTWLHRIVVNACLMRLRSRRRRPEVPIDTLLPVFQEDGHQAQPAREWCRTAEEVLQDGELRALVRRKIGELPEAYRNVILLRDIEELDTAETARLLGISENAVKTRLHRARQALRTLLDPLFRGE